MPKRSDCYHGSLFDEALPKSQQVSGNEGTVSGQRERTSPSSRV